MPGDGSRLVYSTDGGRVRPPAARPPPRKASPSSREPLSPADGVVRIQRDSRGRKGKTATTITGLPGDDAALDALLKALKQHCGAGGARDGRTLEIQGDQRDPLLEKLTALGYQAKLAGG
ncbi:MAG: translation initiation factor [Tepidiformaceae bacterium]